MNTDIHKSVEKLYVDRHKQFLALAYSITKDRYAAEEVVSEVYEMLLTHDTEFRINPFSYAVAMVRNRAAHSKKKSRKDRNTYAKQDFDLDSLETAYRDPLDSMSVQVAETLEQTIDALPLNLRMTLALMMNNYSQKEMAAIFSITRAGVGNRVSSLRRKIRSQIGDLMPPDFFVDRTGFRAI